ncbi:hypothetical protein FB451DRAFT_1396127 [Mycena latifolia]|nr:hypothetical protein FB451DRAFT_1396127 [Mycena latifolia]
MHIPSILTLGAAFITVVFTPSTLADPVTETVITPGGHRLRENIHQVPAGGRIAHVGNDIHIIATNGSVVDVATPASTTTSDAIIQPVLQYGVSPLGGGPYWSVASWYLYGEIAYVSPLVNVSVGQRLDGEIKLIGQTGGTFRFFNVPGTRVVVGGAEQMTFATVTLEAHAVTSTSEYPT